MAGRIKRLVRRLTASPLFAGKRRAGLTPMSRTDEFELAELQRRREQRRRDRENRP